METPRFSQEQIRVALREWAQTGKCPEWYRAQAERDRADEKWYVDNVVDR